LHSREIKGKDSSRDTKVTYPSPNRFSLFYFDLISEEKTC
jgi:hypothetical protein